MNEDPPDDRMARLTGVFADLALPPPDQDTLDLLEKTPDRYQKDGEFIPGHVRKLRTNVELILSNDPFYEGRIRLNEFSEALEFDGEPLEDRMTSRIANDICYRYGFEISSMAVAEQLVLVAQSHCYHPVRDYLQVLEWDGECRLATWMQDYLGADDIDFHRSIGVKWAIGAVARVMPARGKTSEGLLIGGPGCKLDNVLVLKGAQGAGKSTAFRVLGGEWFDDPELDLRSKDALMQIHGKWLLEWAEMDALRGREMSQVKSFITRPVDRYRPPYGQFLKVQPRQCTFVGTTNEEAFLNDATGSRRFWPVEIKSVDLKGLARARDQLWAEAIHRYQNGEEWWLEEHEQQLREKASERFGSNDPWNDKVMSFAQGRLGGVTIPDILSCLEVHPKDQHIGHMRRVGAILTRYGWSKVRATCKVNGKRPYVWVPGEGTKTGPRGPLAPELPLPGCLHLDEDEEGVPSAEQIYGMAQVFRRPELPKCLGLMVGDSAVGLTTKRSQALLEWLEELLRQGGTMQEAAQVLDWTEADVRDMYHRLRGVKPTDE